MDLDELLKSIREEDKPKKGGAIVPAKLFGKDRYEAYLGELTANGTIGGKRLSSSERKEAFKKRSDKIGFEKFVDRVLAKKQTQTAGVSRGSGGPQLSGGGALVKSPAGGLANFIKSPVSEETQENFDDILKGIDSILDTLKADQKLEEKKAKEDRKKEEKEKRSKKEGLLESKAFKGIANAATKMLSPVKSLFDKIFDFLSTIILGRITFKLFDWFTDKENKRKIGVVFRFIKDWWPTLLGALILFGGAFLGPVGIIAGLVALAIGFIPKLVDATKQLFGFKKQTEDDAKKSEEDLKKAESDASKDINLDDVQTPDQLKPAEDKLEETKNLKEPAQMKGGGVVPGSGPNKDTIPAMLAPGEFVMSRGAVNKYGVDTLASMNAMGGGTNRPMIKGGTTYAKNGGYMGGEPGGRTKEEEGSSLEDGGGGGKAWWDFLGWVGTGKPKEKTDTASSSSSSGGNYDSFAKEMIKVHEGKRLEVYQDSLGFPTVGYGHLIDSGSPVKGLKVGDTITDQKANQLFDEDYLHHKKAAEKIPGYQKASGKQKAALIDLTFNMGPAWADGFPSFKKAFASGDYETAGNELKDSAWYGQVGRRAPTIVSLIKGKGTGGASYLKDAPTSAPTSAPSGVGGSAATAIASSMSGRKSKSTPKASIADINKAINFKPAKSGTTIGPPIQQANASIDALRAAIDGAIAPSADTSGAAAESSIPNFDAAIMHSSSKVKTIGVSV